MTESYNPTDIIKEAEGRRNTIRANIRQVAEWFHEREGELFDRYYAQRRITDEFGLDDGAAQSLIACLVADTVDPIIQVVKGDGKYVGIVEYHEFEGAYGYVNFDDVRGQEKRVVCAQCVNEATLDSNVTHATAGDPNGSFASDVEYEDLLEGIHSHIEDTHRVSPDEVKTGATLVSPTTIGGNTAFHTGNDGSGSGLDADTLDNNHSSYFNETFRDPTEPSNVNPGDVWFDTSGNNTEFNQYTGSAWQLVTARGPDSPEYPVEGSLWFDSAAGSLKEHDGASFNPVSKTAITFTDEATQFDGSDGETVNLDTALKTSAGSVELSVKKASDTTSRPADSSATNTSTGYGVEINPNQDIEGVIATVSANTGPVQDVFIADSNENILAQGTAGYSAGDTVRLETPMTSGANYYVGTYNDGNSYDYGYDGSDPPFTGTHLDITGSAYDCHPDDGSSVSVGTAGTRCINDISALIPTTTGSGRISWPTQDVDSWDLATLQQTLDGETVTVDVVDSNGNVLISDIGPDEDLGGISASTDVQFDVTLDRSDTSNNPTLDYVARQGVR